jgi:hypothetical protein
MRNRAVSVLAALLVALAAAACSSAPAKQTDAPVETPPPSSAGGGATTNLEATDVAVRKVLQGYLDALNRKAYGEAAGYWSPTANIKPDALTPPGVTNWSFLSSELIDATATIARVQLNFAVDVAAGSQTNYQSGRNLRYVTLVQEAGAWKIQSIANSP